MDSATLDVLLELNRRFYSKHAVEFSATRQQPWQGWRQLLERYEGRTDELSVLDLGCGNARFAASCDRELSCPWSYVAIDSSPVLVKEARERCADLEPSRFEVRIDNLLSPKKSFPSRPEFDLVVMFGVMHHVPGEEHRAALLARAAACVAPGGFLAVSFWQLGESERLMDRTVPPAEVDLPPKSLSAGDHLLSWGDGKVVRYCHHCGPEEAAQLVHGTDLIPVETYRADGKGGGMNLYWVLSSPAEAA